MQPYSGTVTEPSTAGKRPDKRPAWPLTLATVSLVLLTLVLPIALGYFAFVSAFCLPQACDGRDGTGAMIAMIIAAISGFAGAVGGIVAAVAGRGVAVKIVGILALIIGLVTGGFPALLVYNQARMEQLANPPAPEPPGPSCGPESHPAVFGGDSRYTPCPEDAAVADALLSEAVPQLPTTDVTVASVEAIASTISPDAYDTTYLFDNGDLVVAWIPHR